MLAPVVGKRPINVPPVIAVSWLRIKSSALSISSLPGLDGCEAVAISPSGLPVLTTESALTGTAYAQRTSAEARVANQRMGTPPFNGKEQPLFRSLTAILWPHERNAPT